jgi:hypothetical protein
MVKAYILHNKKKKNAIRVSFKMIAVGLLSDAWQDIQEQTQSISAGRLTEDIIFHTVFWQQRQN